MNIPKRIDRTILRASIDKCEQITAEMQQDKAAIDGQNIHDYLDEVRTERGQSYECEMVVEHASTQTLAVILYELAERGHDLTHSPTFQALLEKAAAEDLGI